MKWTIVFTAAGAKMHVAECTCRGRIDEALRRSSNIPAPDSVEGPTLAAAFAGDTVTRLLRQGWKISPARCTNGAPQA